jgi:hypothetical protein
MYGAEKGNFYTEKEVQLWMPARLLKIDNVELNYIAARKENKLLIAFTNQSATPVTTLVTVNSKQARLSAKTSISTYTAAAKNIPVKDSSFTVTVPANGIAAVALDNVQMNTAFQQKILSTTHDTSSDFAAISEGHAKAMLFKMGEYARRLYVYLEDDDNTWKQAKLVYTDAKGKEQVVTKAEYPFEFTIPVDLKKPVRFSLHLTGVNGQEVKSKTIELGK